MRVPIPDDWQGNFTCIRVDWPDSPKWLAVLAGLLTTPMQGRYWDERTGQIIDAQAIGWQIHELNFPLRGCEGSPVDIDDNLGGLVNGWHLGAAIIEEEVDMGQVVTDLKVVDGKLRVYFGPCCYTDLAGIEAGQAVPVIGQGDYTPPGGSEPTYSTCGAAFSVVDAVFSVLTSIETALSGDFEFWRWTSSVETEFGYNLKDSYLTALIAAFKTLGAVWSATEIWSVYERQETVHELEAYFDTYGIGIPDDSAFNAVKNILYRNSGSFFPDQGYVGLAYDAIGRTLLNSFVWTGALDDSQDCSSPAAPLGDPTIAWTGLDWSHWFDFTQADKPAWMSFGSGASAAYEYGTGLKKVITGGGLWRILLHMPLDPEAGVVTNVYALLDMPSGFNYSTDADKNWVATDDQGPFVQLGSAGWYDTIPSGGGDIIVNKSGLSFTLTGLDNTLSLDVSGGDSVQDGSHYFAIQGFAVGGTGTDPFSNH